MQLNRLFETVYMLLNKKNITAKELSEHFEVSVRTIYRDLDTLSGAGIPIYAYKGKGGGIRLMDDFVLNKSMLTEQEQNNILMSLQSLNAAKYPDIEPVLSKMSLLFNKQGTSWIDVDFSRWGSDDREKEKFAVLKTAILNMTVVSFNYFNSYGEKTERTVEPIKLIFKGQSWYLYGFCQVKKDFRIFKITRIRNLRRTEEVYEREIPNDIWNHFERGHKPIVTLVLNIAPRLAYRVYDEFDPESIKENENGSFTVTVAFPEDEWLYGYILSFGMDAEVIEPKHIRERIKRTYQEGAKKYL